MKNVALDRVTSFVISFIIFVLVVRNSLYLELFPNAHALFSGLRFLSWALFAMLFIKAMPKIDWMGFWLLLYGIIIGYTTIANKSESIFPVVSMGVDILMIWGIFKIYLPEYCELFLRTMIKSFCICVYFNFFLLLLFPNGFYNIEGNSYFILGGNYNQMGRTIIPAIAIYGYYTTIFNKGKIGFYVLTILSLITLFIVGSKTSIIGVVLLLTFYIIKSYRIRKWMFIAFVIVYALFQITTVFAQRDLTEYTYFTYFIEEVLQKDMTFSLRTDVWYKSFILIMDSPLLGYGYRSPEWFSDLLDVKTTHNLILHILIIGGICALIPFTIQIIFAIKKSSKSGSLASQYLMLSFWTFMFMMIMEVYSYTYIALFLLLLYNSEYFESINKD